MEPSFRAIVTLGWVWRTVVRAILLRVRFGRGAGPTAVRMIVSFYPVSQNAPIAATLGMVPRSGSK